MRRSSTSLRLMLLICLTGYGLGEPFQTMAVGGGVAGEECSDPFVIELPQSFAVETIEFSNVDSTTDGPDHYAECGGALDVSTQNDKWVAVRPCGNRLTLDVCDSGFDVVIAVYTNGTHTCPHELGECPPSEDDRVFCSVNECPVGGGPTTELKARMTCKGGSEDGQDCDWDGSCPGGMCEAQCFLVRLSGQDGDTGTGQIEARCVFEHCATSSAVAQETIFNETTEEGELNIKNRFLSFSVGDPGQAQAIRVSVESVTDAHLQHLVGATWWVQPKQAISEAGSSRLPLRDFPIFWASRLGCEPFYDDWHGFCDGGNCAGNACAPVSCFDNTCQRGPLVGETCTVDADCGLACLGGPNNGLVCAGERGLCPGV